MEISPYYGSRIGEIGVIAQNSSSETDNLRQSDKSF